MGGSDSSGGREEEIDGVVVVVEPVGLGLCTVVVAVAGWRKGRERRTRMMGTREWIRGIWQSQQQ